MPSAITVTRIVPAFQIRYSLSIFAFSWGDGSSRIPISSSMDGILFSCFLVKSAH